MAHTLQASPGPASPGPLALEPPPPPRRPGVLAGFKSLLSGIGWLATTPATWPLAMVPVAIAMVLTVVLGWSSVALVPVWIGELLGPTSGLLAGLGAVLLKVLATVVAVVVATLVAYALAQPLAGPALESLVRRQREALGLTPQPQTSLLVDVWRSLQSLLIGYAFGLPVLALLLLLTFLVPYASVVLFPLKMLVAAVTVAWDLCDYPLSVAGRPVGERIATVARHLPAVIGLGLGLALAGFVPCLLFILLPAGVAGATRLMAQVERWDASQPSA